MLKQASTVGSASPDPAVDAAAAESIPAPSISNKPPPGQTGPRGMQSRQTYSRVNTGTPQTPEAGASAQKNTAPGGLDFLPKLSEARMNTTPRPTIQDMVKAAMAGAISRVDITNEAIHQYGGEVKTASAEYEGQSLPTDLINKLADALGYVADQIEKGAAIEFSGGSTAGVGAGEGPGHLHVMQAEVISSKNPSQPGQTGGRDQAGAPMESGATKTAPTNAMGTNESMRHPEQPADPMNGKTAGALAAANLDRLSKVGFSVTDAGHKFDAAQAKAVQTKHEDTRAARESYDKESPVLGSMLGHPARNLGDRLNARHHAYVAREHAGGSNAYNPLGGLLTKTDREKKAAYQAKHAGNIVDQVAHLAPANAQYIREVFGQVKAAEDALNPAKIQAGRTGGPVASGTASGEAVPSQPSDVSAQERLIESNMAAINYTKREAKRDPHEDARRVFNSPVMKDPVLDQVWANSGKAGVKTSSRNDVVKIAAARALLSKLAADSTESRKLKTSNMGTAGTPPPPPARQSTISGPAFTQPSV